MAITSKQAVKTLKQGGIILYPTEGVYGLGCDPFNETAVLRLLKTKHRHVNKGLILLAASWGQVKELVKIDLKKCAIIKKSIYPTTWIFPANKKVPRWITGRYNSVAIRVTSHPVAKNICQKFGGPIVSTSANLSQKTPIKNLSQVDKNIMSNVDFIAYGHLGGLGKPTQIREVITGKVLRD